MPETENRKSREPSRYFVEYQDEGVWIPADKGASHPDSAKALAWIRANGVNSKTYRVIRVVAGPFVVKTESVVKRTLE